MEKELKFSQKKKIKFPVVGNLVECSKCKRKILVERALIGVNHTIGLIATCWECLDKKTQQKANKKYKLDTSLDEN